MQHSALTITCALRISDKPAELIVLRDDPKLRLPHNEAALRLRSITYVLRLAPIQLSTANKRLP